MIPNSTGNDEKAKKGGHLRPRKIPMTSRLFELLRNRYENNCRCWSHMSWPVLVQMRKHSFMAMPRRAWLIVLDGRLSAETNSFSLALCKSSPIMRDACDEVSPWVIFPASSPRCPQRLLMYPNCRLDAGQSMFCDVMLLPPVGLQWLKASSHEMEEEFSLPVITRDHGILISPGRRESWNGLVP